MPDNQSGFCYPYCVKKTVDKGLGIFARVAITKGSIVWRHVPGLYVVYDEHSFKAMIKNMSHDEVVYQLTHCFGLADFPGCMIQVLDDGVLINHSNNANLLTNNANPANAALNVDSRDYLDTVTKTLLDDQYGLIATRDIGMDEELTNNYNIDCAEPPYYDSLFDQYDIREDYLNGD